MATQKNLTGTYSGRPAFFISFSVTRAEVSGTRARWSWTLDARNPNGSTLTYMLDNKPWSVSVAGQSFSGSHNLDFRSGVTTIRLGSGKTGWIEQGSGTPTINMSASHSNAGVFGTASVSGSFVADRLATAPGRPAKLKLTNVTTSGATFTRTAPSDGGSPITNYSYQIATATNFSNVIQSWSSTAASQSRSGLSANSNYWARVRATNAVGTGDWSEGLVIVTLPAKAAAPTITATTTTSITATRPAPGGTAYVTAYEWQAATNSGFSAGLQSWSSSSASQTRPGLTPGTQYWIRYRIVNASGAGAWSNAATTTTVAATAPGMTVTPAITGTSATVVLSPPNGFASVTSYRVERRPVGGSTTVHNTSGSTLTVYGLTPGTTYEWRASAFIGSYQTPWTAWVTRTQPNPNTTPGDYFDGSTPPKTNVTYAWDGTTNSSTSRAVGKTPLGWGSFASGASASGGSGVVTRVTGGRSGTFAARVIFFGDTTSPGFRAGISRAATGASDVAEGGIYWGSIYVSPSRSQRMAAYIEWLNSSRAVISRSVGSAVVVAANASPMVRLTVQGTAPAGAVYASVGWVDVSGVGWSTWQGGESVLMDDAMLTIGELYPWFSGDTADTADFAYTWQGPANASVSQRERLAVTDRDPLADPNCPAPPSPPRPPRIVDDCIQETGAWRRYWAIIPAQMVPLWLDVVPTFVITTAALPARQVRIRIWENPDALSPDEYLASDWVSEQIIGYMPARTTITIDGVAQRVWADTESQSAIPADRLLYGSGGLPATWSALSCGQSYLVSFDVPLDAPIGNLDIQAQLTTRML